MRIPVFAIVFLGWVIPIACLAQSDSLIRKFTFLQTEYDSSYIHELNYNWEVRIDLQEKNNSFKSANKSGSQSIFFEPLTALTLGAGASYKNFSLGYGFAINNNRGDTAHATGFDFSTSLYVSQHIFDLGFRRFSGYYVSGYDSLQNELLSIFRGDITTDNLYMSYLYNFNFRKFSFNASFIGTEQQMKSAGAPLAGLFFNYNDLHANTSIVPPQISDANNALLPISEANIWTAGLMAGYAYTFVLPLNFYLTLSLVPGFALSVGEAKTDKYFTVGNPVTPSFKLVSKNAFGYSGNRVYGYVSITSDKNWLRLSNNDRFTNNLGRWRLMIGYLFD